MIAKYVHQLMRFVTEHFFQDKIRRGSIQAVKVYVQGVKAARLSLMGLVALGAFSALMVAGLILTIVGIVALLPITPTAAAISILSVGVVLMLATGITLFVALNERKWLEISKSNELIDAVLEPWPTAYPPNPMDVVMKRGAYAPEIAGEEKIPQAQREAKVEFDSLAMREDFGREGLATP